jgi:hypothetical protein
LQYKCGPEAISRSSILGPTRQSRHLPPVAKEAWGGVSKKCCQAWPRKLKNKKKMKILTKRLVEAVLQRIACSDGSFAYLELGQKKKKKKKKKKLKKV